ncbi:LSP-T protein precursor [Bombyx mori]|uniref:BmLSP-T n=1 Tax=Bombyx mori TaxID=7091 RepID=Q75RW3_BOMMO|nr:LSP-T protein precursor [Bombyx mori]BAD07027.1 BmLSP-T [Bombyx mori]
MKTLAVLALCLVAASATPSIDGDDRYPIHAPSGYEDIVTNAIITRNYEAAASMTVQLKRRSSGRYITIIVNRLIRENKRNICDLAYKLWDYMDESQEIVKEYFPVIFRQIFSENSVKIINKRDNLAIKLGDALDSDNDRVAYGDANDKTSDNVAWKLIPLWDDNRVYFKIFSVHRNQIFEIRHTYLTVDNDHGVYGDDRADTHRHQWYLNPVELENQVLFYIYNRQYDQALKLGRNVDSDGDRRAYSSSSSVEGQPELYAWSISILN